MARKRKGASAAATDSEPTELLELDTTTAVVPLDVEPVKVNNANFTEIKNACDDAVRRVLSRPDQFKQRHRHTDIRLALGWGSVIVAGLTGLYGYLVEFEQSKIGIAVGVVLYFILSSAEQLYKWLAEKDVIFVGRRKSVAGRIEAEHILIQSRLNPEPRTAPTYRLTVNYKRTTNGGKTLLYKPKTKPIGETPVGQWFDEEGNMDVAGFEAWVAGLVASGMGVVEE